MVTVCGMNTKEENRIMGMAPRVQFRIGNSSLAQDLMPHEIESSSSSATPKHVVIVMDRLEEFSLEPVEWVLKNIALSSCCNITLLGVMPWLNIPLSSKTWSDIWSVDLEDLSILREKSELKNDGKYQRVKSLVDLCQKYGVMPQMKAEMGYPLELLVVEHIVGLHATLVVFDRHHRKYREYYTKRIPCNMVMMNDDGGVDIIKTRPLIDNEVISTPGGESPASAPKINLMFSQRLRNLLKRSMFD